MEERTQQIRARVPMSDQRLMYARQHVTLYQFDSSDRGFMAGLLEDLLAEREALREQLRQARDNEETATTLYTDVQAAYDELRAKYQRESEALREQLRLAHEALAIYADEANWKEPTGIGKFKRYWARSADTGRSRGGKPERGRVSEHGFKVARAALAGTVPLAQPPTCQKCGGKGYLVDSVHGEPWQACECQVAQPQPENPL